MCISIGINCQVMLHVTTVATFVVNCFIFSLSIFSLSLCFHYLIFVITIVISIFLLGLTNYFSVTGNFCYRQRNSNCSMRNGFTRMRVMKIAFLSCRCRKPGACRDVTASPMHSAPMQRPMCIAIRFAGFLSGHYNDTTQLQHNALCKSTLNLNSP